jgi:RNA recognition motif-containing protein
LGIVDPFFSFFNSFFTMNIFVAKLNYDTTSEGLQAAFEAFGEVESAKVVMDHETGRSRGFGFVEMPNEDDAWKAIEALNENELDGNTIVVKKAEPRGDRNRGGGRGGFNRGGGGGGYDRRGGGGGYDRRGGGGGYDRRGGGGGYDRRGGGGGYDRGSSYDRNRDSSSYDRRSSYDRNQDSAYDRNRDSSYDRKSRYDDNNEY